MSGPVDTELADAWRNGMASERAAWRALGTREDWPARVAYLAMLIRSGECVLEDLRGRLAVAEKIVKEGTP